MRLPRRASGNLENGGGDGNLEVDGVDDDEGTVDVVDVDDVNGIGGAVADSMAGVVSSTQGLKARLRTMTTEHVGSMAMVQRGGTGAMFNLARQRLPTSGFRPIWCRMRSRSVVWVFGMQEADAGVGSKQQAWPPGLGRPPAWRG